MNEIFSFILIGERFIHCKSRRTCMIFYSKVLNYVDFNRLENMKLYPMLSRQRFGNRKNIHSFHLSTILFFIWRWLSWIYVKWLLHFKCIQYQQLTVRNSKQNLNVFCINEQWNFNKRCNICYQLICWCYMFICQRNEFNFIQTLIMSISS